MSAGAAGGDSSQAAARRVARNSLALFTSDASTKVLLVVLYAIIARLLGASGFGDYTLAVSLAFFIRACALGTGLILTREVARDVDNVHGLFWDSIVLKLAAGIPVLIGVVAFSALSGYPAALVVAVAAIGVSTLIDMVALSLHAVLQGRQQMGPPALALGLRTVLLVAFGSAALFAFRGLVALAVVYIVASVLALVYISVAMLRRGIRPRLRGQSSRLRWLLRASLPTGIAAFFGVALSRLDAIMLSVMTHSSVTVGFYGSAYRLFEATQLTAWAFGAAIFPLLATRERQTVALRRVFEVSAMAASAVSMPLGGALALFGPTLVALLFGPGFEGAGTATRILGAANLGWGLFVIAGLTLVSQQRQGLLPWFTGASLVLNVVLNLVLIPPLRQNGAAIAMTAALTLLAALTLWFAIRETGPLSAVRMLAGPVAGLAAMSAVALPLGPGVVALVISLAAFGVAFLGAEWWLHRDDLMLFVQSVRSRGTPAEPPVQGEATVL